MNYRGLTILVAMIVAAACTYRPSRTITCDHIRALRIGMTTSEVRNILGAPYGEGWPGTGYAEDAILLDYSMAPGQWNPAHIRSISGGVRLFAYFSEGRLSEVASWRRYYGSQSVSILELKGNDRFESPLFRPIFCP